MRQVSVANTSVQQSDSGHPREASDLLFVVGIDLGTTNSLLAVAGLPEDVQYLPAPGAAEQEQPSLGPAVPVRLLKLPQRNLDGTEAEHVLFPSVVFQADPAGPRFVGMGAREAKFDYTKDRSVFYSVKRDLGTDRDPFYSRAVTPDLNTPVKVTAVILRAMKEAAETKLGRSLSGVPTIVTVPASFQSAQRRDTVMAARMAGLKVDEHCLFDEPNAALLAYMNRHRIQLRWHPEETVLVFDFGGGTCDVSIIDVSYVPSSKRPSLKSLAISRFERLGGDDIDRHIVHEYLAERFYVSSGRGLREWSLTERRSRIWSQLSRMAELLKVRFSEELEKVTQSQGWDESVLNAVRVALPPQTIHTSQGEVVLSDLSLDWPTFEHMISPFVAADCSQNADREYYRITSVFSPIQDALTKANLKAGDITRILLVGGSSFNPLIERALRGFFPEAMIDRPADMDFLVGEGAAVQAYWRFIIGHDPLLPIVGDTIGLLTEGEQFVPLVHAGSAIPFPGGAEWMTFTQFRVPRDWMSHVDFVICAGSKERPVHVVSLAFDRVVLKDSAVHLKIRLDGNKVFQLEAFLPEHPEIHVAESIENPLTQLPLTPLERERIELEKTLSGAQATGTLDQHVDDMVQMAEVLDQMDRDESALEWVNLAIRKKGKASEELSCLKAKLHHQLGENDVAHGIWVELSEQEPSNAAWAINASLTAAGPEDRGKYARKAVAADPGSGIAHFALGVAQQRIGDHTAARDCFEAARRLMEMQLKLQPGLQYLVPWLANVYRILGEDTKALELTKRYERAGSKESIVDTTNLVALTSELTSL